MSERIVPACSGGPGPSVCAGRLIGAEARSAGSGAAWMIMPGGRATVTDRRAGGIASE